MRLLPPETLITLALGLAIAGLVTSVILFVCIAIVRYWRHRRTEAQRAFVAEWQHILRVPAADVPADELPPVSSRDRFLFVRTWCQAYEDVLSSHAAPGERDTDVSFAIGHLRRIGEEIDLLSIAVSVAQVDSFHRQLVALKCMGYLKDASALPLLDDAMSNENPYLSLAAFQAMVRIDRKYAVYHRTGTVRPDWPDDAYQNIIREAQEQKTTGRLPEAAQADAGRQTLQTREPERWAEVLSRMKRRVHLNVPS